MRNKRTCFVNRFGTLAKATGRVIMPGSVADVAGLIAAAMSTVREVKQEKEGRGRSAEDPGSGPVSAPFLIGTLYGEPEPLGALKPFENFGF